MKPNDKPFLLIIQMPGANHWYYIRLEKAQYALWEIPRLNGGWQKWTVVRDIRNSFWDFHDHDLLVRMREAVTDWIKNESEDTMKPA